MAIEPDIFLAQDDVHLLVQALNTLALEVDSPDERKEMLVNAGIDLAFRSKLTFGISPYLFANKLTAQFREYPVSVQQPAYHPMVSLLDYLLKAYQLEDQDRNLFQRLVKQGMENFSGLAALRAVGRIESPLGTAMGTGVLVDKQVLLTCKHVFERIFDQGLRSAWVRFGYKTGKYGLELGEVFELDISSIHYYVTQSNHTLDYALARINGETACHAVSLSSAWLNRMQNVRIVHHPRGEAAQISDIGQIVAVNKEYIQHNIKTDYGSSGAPIFDQNWQVVAIHRGILALSRSYAPGVTEAIPVGSMWNDIKSHFSC